MNNTDRDKLTSDLRRQSYRPAEASKRMADTFVRDSTTVTIIYAQAESGTHVEAATVTHDNYSIPLSRKPQHNLADHGRRLAYQAGGVDPSDQSPAALRAAISAAAAEPAQLVTLFERQLREHSKASRMGRPVNDEDDFATKVAQLTVLTSDIAHSVDRDAVAEAISGASELLTSMSESVHPPTCVGCRTQHRSTMQVINWTCA